MIATTYSREPVFQVKCQRYLLLGSVRYDVLCWRGDCLSMFRTQLFWQTQLQELARRGFAYPYVVTPQARTKYNIPHEADDEGVSWHAEDPYGSLRWLCGTMYNPANEDLV